MEAGAAWDRFWHFDRLSSFLTGPGAANYGQVIAGGWRDFFAALPEGARILDLCTGNGAIAVMAMETCRDFEVTGVDLADIAPASFVSRNLTELRQIRFVPKVAVEELPFLPQSFDAVISQYGIEYSDMTRSLPEAVRVLAPGGRLRFATHAAEGNVAANTRAAIAEADFLIDGIDLTGRAEHCLAHPSTASEAAFADGLRAVEERMASSVDVGMLSAVHRLLKQNHEQRHSTDPATLIGWARTLRDDIAAHRERQRELLRSALSAEALANLAGQIESLGLTEIEIGEQRDGEDLIGHVIEAALPA